MKAWYGQLRSRSGGNLIQLQQVDQRDIHNILGVEDSLQVIHEAHLGTAFNHLYFNFRFFLADVRAHEVNGVALCVECSAQHRGIVASSYFKLLRSLSFPTPDASY